LEEVCAREQELLARLTAGMKQAAGRDELDRLARTLVCERLRPSVVALQAEVAHLAASAARTAAQVGAAQDELRRIGCYSGHADGVLQEATQDAIRRYLSRNGNGRSAAEVRVSEDLVKELKAAPVDFCVEAATPQKSKQIVRPAQRDREPLPKKTAIQSPAPVPSMHLMIGVGF
jgi:hypothetical protein